MAGKDPGGLRDPQPPSIGYVAAHALRMVVITLVLTKIIEVVFGETAMKLVLFNTVFGLVLFDALLRPMRTSFVLVTPTWMKTAKGVMLCFAWPVTAWMMMNRLTQARRGRKEASSDGEGS